MTAATSHPLAAAYLRDLDLLLHGLDPGVRAEVVAGVREHLSDALGPDATSEQVQAVLAELGSPQSIADEAYADRPVLTQAPSPSALPSRWQSLVACALNGAGLAYLLLLLWAGVSGADLFRGLVVLTLPWILVVALSVRSPVWTTRQMTTSIALVPATLSCLALLTGLLLAAVGPSPLNAIPVLALLGASGWVLARLARQATS